MTLQTYHSTHKGMNIHMIPTKKYKTITLVAKLKAQLTKETATKRALLSYVLEKGTEQYPTEKALQMKLDELYGAVFGIYCSKMGENHIITFRMEIANEKYIEQASGILEEAITLLADIMYSPHTSDNSFPEATMKREKTTLQNKLASIYDDKMAYANMRLIDEMFKDEAYATHTYGYPEDISAITASDLYDYYTNDVLEHDACDLYIIGDMDKETTEKAITSTFKTSRTTLAKSEKENQEEVTGTGRDTVQVVTDRQPIQQAKLHIGYRTNVTNKDKEHAALRIFNSIFGGTPSSKLFVNVREKNSLAYYVGSRLEMNQGFMIVLSGIEPEKEMAAREIIHTQLEAMRHGDFTEEDVAENKAYLISQVKETLDAAVGTIELLYNGVVNGRAFSPETYIEELNKVTKADIIQIANEIKEDTIYVLTSEEDETHA